MNELFNLACKLLLFAEKKKHSCGILIRTVIFLELRPWLKKIKFNFSQNSSPASSSSYQQNSVVTEKDKNYFEEEKDEDGEVSSDDEKEKKKDGEFL